VLTTNSVRRVTFEFAREREKQKRNYMKAKDLDKIFDDSAIGEGH